MGGRGRGRAALSFNVEALGIQQGEALPGPVLQPPPAYPVLEAVTAPIYPSLKFGETLKYKKDFLNYYSRLKVDAEEATTPGYKRRFDSTSITSTQNKKDRPQLNYDWTRFPAELRPGITKKAKIVPKVKIKSMADIDKMLAQLEQKENALFNADESIVKVEKVQDEENEDEEGAGEEEEQDSDQEMDDGTDYNSNYFDNGESYLEEDDDADDGPIY
ncbi:hypothetical protein O3M35_011111 [Rhynocoris fuscipes]|uniref:DNA-directed RNA polymerase III subunit n=1 Tax=Rhynocoris fuscipes TaxID=488301 RepID=A0AAW1D0A7_9HEMI